MKPQPATYAIALKDGSTELVEAWSIHEATDLAIARWPGQWAGTVQHAPATPHIVTDAGKRVFVGDLVTYTAFGGERRTVRVEEVSEDIKNGRPGFCGADGWGYADQIERVSR